MSKFELFWSKLVGHQIFHEEHKHYVRLCFNEVYGKDHNTSSSTESSIDMDEDKANQRFSSWAKFTDYIKKQIGFVPNAMGGFL